MAKDLKRIGCQEAPIRISSLTQMSRCQMAWTLRQLQDQDDSGSSEAANLGTAVQRGNELWHKGLDVKEASRVALAELGENSGGIDPDELLRVLMGYSSDPRNAQTGMPSDPVYGEVVTSALEMVVDLVVPCKSGDCYLTGHVDFIRRYRDKRLHLWDGKHSRHSATILSWEYAYQIAAYTVAASAKMGETVYPGGIVATREYDKGPRARTAAQPFVETAMTLDTCKRLVYDYLPPMIDQIRAQKPTVTPGQHCDPYSWRCHGGPAACIPAFDRAIQGEAALDAAFYGG